MQRYYCQFCIELSYSLDIVQERRMLFRIISDADKYSFEWDSLRCTSLDKSLIHSPLAAFNSLYYIQQTEYTITKSSYQYIQWSFISVRIDATK